MKTYRRLVCGFLGACLFMLAGCTGQPSIRPPQISAARVDANGRELLLQANVNPNDWQNYRVFLRYGRPVDDWAIESTQVYLGKVQGALSYVLPDGMKYKGSILQYQWWVEYALPGGDDYEVVTTDLLQTSIPTFMVLPPLSDEEVDILFENTLVFDGNLQPSTRANAESFAERTSLVRETMGVDAHNRTNPTQSSLIDSVSRVDDSDSAVVVRTSYDIERAYRDGKVAMIFYVQKHFPLDNDVSRLEEFYQDGLRVFQIAYGVNGDADNTAPDEQLGGGRSDPANLGITPLGEQAIDELNHLHMVIDCSHCNTQTIMDTVMHSTFPVTANHAAADAVYGNARNLDDVDLENIANSGGIIGILALDRFLVPSDSNATTADFVGQVNHIVDLVGIDHVGLASDSNIDGSGNSPELSAMNRWKTVIQDLSREQNPDGTPRYTIEDLRKIMGWNFLRVYQQVLVGHTKPVLHEPEIDDRVALFSWEPSQAIEVDDLSYRVFIYSATETGEFQELTRVELGGTRIPIPIADLLQDNGRPYFKYRWFVRADSNMGFTNSLWGTFFLASP